MEVVLRTMVCGRMQVPGQWAQAPGRRRSRRSTELAEGFLFRAGVWRVVMSLEGKRPRWGWASGVGDDDRRPTNDRLPWEICFDVLLAVVT